MKISNLAPVISIAREPEHKEKNLTLHRGYDENEAARYIITSTLNGPEIETLGFFYTLDDAIECLVANHKLVNLKSFLLENPQPGNNPATAKSFLRFIREMGEDIDRGIRDRIYDDIPDTEFTDEIDDPDDANKKSLGLTRELNKLVDQFVNSIQDAISGNP